MFASDRSLTLGNVSYPKCVFIFYFKKKNTLNLVKRGISFWGMI